MKYLKYYELENEYNEEKDTYEFPTVSYTQDTDKVWYMKSTPSVKNIVKMVFSITEDDVNNYGGSSLMVWENSVLFDSVKVDGVEQYKPLQEKNIIITGETTEGEFMFDESCYINDECIKKCDLIFNEPIPGDWHKYFLTMQFQVYNDGMWMDYINFTQPLSVWIGEGITDGFIANGKSELVGVDLYYLNGGFLDKVGPTARMLVHVVCDENAVQNGETGNFIVNVNEDTLVDSHINMMIGGMSILSLPTAEVKNYEVVASKYEDMTDMNGMFAYCNNLTSLDFSNFDTSNVTNMSNMFRNCNGLTSLDLSSFDTSNVTSMSNMFSECRSLTSIDLSSFDTSNVTRMDYMFSSCDSLTSLDLNSFDTSNITNMQCMFNGCTSLTSVTFGDKFDTSNVNDMTSMFSSCDSLTSLDLSSFDTSNVAYMYGMFRDCSSLTHLVYFHKTPNKCKRMVSDLGLTNITSVDFSGWDASNVTSMSALCNECYALTSVTFAEDFDTSNVTNMREMFWGCSVLTSVTFGSQANVNEVESYSSMFSNITTTGTLYYPSAYANCWNYILVTKQSTSNFPSTWTAVAVDYENGETAPMSE